MQLRSETAVHWLCTESGPRREQLSPRALPGKAFVLPLVVPEKLHKGFIQEVDPWISIYILELACQFYPKKAWDYDWGHVESMEELGENWHIDNIESSYL